MSRHLILLTLVSILISSHGSLAVEPVEIAKKVNQALSKPEGFIAIITDKAGQTAEVYGFTFGGLQGNRHYLTAYPPERTVVPAIPPGPA